MHPHTPHSARALWPYRPTIQLRNHTPLTPPGHFGPIALLSHCAPTHPSLRRGPLALSPYYPIVHPYPSASSTHLHRARAGIGFMVPAFRNQRPQWVGNEDFASILIFIKRGALRKPQSQIDSRCGSHRVKQIEGLQGHKVEGATVLQSQGLSRYGGHRAEHLHRSHHQQLWRPKTIKIKQMQGSDRKQLK